MKKFALCLCLIFVLSAIAGCSGLPGKTSSSSQEAKQSLPSGWSSSLKLIELNKIVHINDNGYESDEIYGAAQTVKINKNDYDIDITLKNRDTNSFYHDMDISVNGVQYSQKKIYSFNLDYAAAAGIDGGDTLLFVATRTENDWVDLYIYRYDGKQLTPVRMTENNPDEEIYSGGYGITNTADTTIALRDNTSIEMWKKTKSRGMWNLKKTYALKNNVFTLNEQANYEVDAIEFLTPKASYDKISDIPYCNSMSKEEYDRLSEGYVMCHKDYSFLKEGTYFTPIYDDCNNNIFIRTKDGQEGWLKVPDYNDTREEISYPLFFLAG